MLNTPMDVLERFPVRKSGKQKAAFRAAVQGYARELGYEYREEKGSFGCRNVVLGDPERAEYLVTAHYDTCAALPFPNLITPCALLPFLGYQLLICVFLLLLPLVPALAVGYLAGNFEIGYTVWYVLFWVCLGMMLFGPANRSNANDNTSGVVTVLEIARTLPQLHRGKVCFVLFDLEEAGLIGSAAYRKAHKKQTGNQLVLNLDCVGDGDTLMLFPTKKLRKDPKRMEVLRTLRGSFGVKRLDIREKGFAVYPSDQSNFPYGVGICALRKGPVGLYLGRIHTKRDTILEQTNVNLLRSALTSLITRAENTNRSTLSKE